MSENLLSALSDLLRETVRDVVRDVVREELQAVRESAPGWLSVRAAAAHLGISEQALRDLLRRREIASYRPNGRVFLSREDLDRWVRSGAETVPTE